MDATQSLRLVSAAALVAAGLLLLPARGVAADRCSVESLPVGKAAVKITICAAPPAGAGAAASVPLTETFVSGGTSFVRSSQVDFFAGAAVSRSIEDVALAKLGLASTLHLTIAYRQGLASIEHALLLPGAIPLK